MPVVAGHSMVEEDSMFEEDCMVEEDSMIAGDGHGRGVSAEEPELTLPRGLVEELGGTVINGMAFFPSDILEAQD